MNWCYFVTFILKKFNKSKSTCMKTLHLKNIFKAKIKDNALREESTIYGEQVGEKRCVWVCVCGTFGGQIRGVLVACTFHTLADNVLTNALKPCSDTHAHLFNIKSQSLT